MIKINLLFNLRSARVNLTNPGVEDLQYLLQIYSILVILLMTSKYGKIYIIRGLVVYILEHYPLNQRTEMIGRIRY